jgi:hypothetical protein
MNRIITLFLITKLIVIARILHAQSIWLEPQEISVAIEWLRPGLKGVSSTLLTSVLFVTARLPLSQNITLVGDLPIAHFDGRLDRFRGTRNPRIPDPVPAWETPTWEWKFENRLSRSLQN